MLHELTALRDRETGEVIGVVSAEFVRDRGAYLEDTEAGVEAEGLTEQAVETETYPEALADVGRATTPDEPLQVVVKGNTLDLDRYQDVIRAVQEAGGHVEFIFLPPADE